MEYKPDPVDTRGILLPPELDRLAERLAVNTHDVWALRRMRDGWTYGKKRDDEGKTHPCLIPFNELPESEKEYDRSVVTETLRLMIALGYRISKE